MLQDIVRLAGKPAEPFVVAGEHSTELTPASKYIDRYATGAVVCSRRSIDHTRARPWMDGYVGSEVDETCRGIKLRDHEMDSC